MYIYVQQRPRLYSQDHDNPKCIPCLLLHSPCTNLYICNFEYLMMKINI